MGGYVFAVWSEPSQRGFAEGVDLLNFRARKAAWGPERAALSRLSVASLAVLPPRCSLRVGVVSYQLPFHRTRPNNTALCHSHPRRRFTAYPFSGLSRPAMAPAAANTIVYLFSRTAGGGGCRTLTVAARSRSSLRLSRSAQLHRLPFRRKATSW